MDVLRFAPRNRPDLQISVDAVDLHLIVNLSWTAVQKERSQTSYAASRVDGREVFLHRRIMGCAWRDGVEVNHLDGNGLNCIRANLELCSHRENCHHARTLARNWTGQRFHSIETIEAGEKAVRKRLADGTVKVYVYDRGSRDFLRSFIETK